MGVALAAVSLALVFLRNTSPLVETPAHGRADVYVAPAAVTISARVRRQAIATAARFVETAVRRDHPERAWELAAPALRAGTTRAAWLAGDIPVVPYPVDAARWKLAYAYAGEVGLEVAVFPEPGSALAPAVFDVSLRRAGERWLVASWLPRGGSSARRGDGSPFALAAAAPSASTRLDARWLLVPVVLLALGLAAPFLVLLGRSRR